jgi:hypothetical protein
MKKQSTDTRRLATTSLLLLLTAVVFAVAATAAWFSISDNTLVHSMNMGITSGSYLRFDLDAHESISEYRRTLGFAEICDRIRADYGTDPRTSELVPVTTQDVETFTLRNGDPVEPESGAYLEFPLHFMATKDMDVHLTSVSSGAGGDGTLVTSAVAGMPEAIRIGFAGEGGTSVFDPGPPDKNDLSANVFENIQVFRLPSAADMIYNKSNSILSLRADTDQLVMVRIWLEGTDEACTNELKGGDYTIRLRFVGTDEDGNLIVDS